MARIAEAEETVDSLQQKIANCEKSKARMQSDLEEISMEYERTHAAAIITEKRGKNFDKVIECNTRCQNITLTLANIFKFTMDCGDGGRQVVSFIPSTSTIGL